MLRNLDTAAFEALAPWVAQLRHLQRTCQPFGPEWSALAVALAALNEAAEIATGQESFYRDKGNHR